MTTFTQTVNISNFFESSILVGDMSDHFPILAVIKYAEDIKLQNCIKMRKLTSENIENFVEDVAVSLHFNNDISLDVNVRCNFLINCNVKL